MKNNKLTMIILAGAALAAGACQESIQYKDVVFFTGTENSPVTSMYVDGPSSMGMTVTSSAKLASEVTVSVEVNGAAVDSYNAANGTAYKMLPEGSYRLSSDSFRIEAGKNVSLPVNFEIVSMDDFEEGVLYCAPLTITGTSNGMDVLEASRTTYVLINQIITTKGVDLKQSNYVKFPSIINNSMFSNMSACTMEIRVYMNSYYSESANPGIASVMGVEENFLLRFGDISCKKNQLQYAGRGASVTSKSQFNTKQWYHLAVVDDGTNLVLYVDGEVEGEVASSGKSAINLAWDYMDGFHIGFSERGRMMNGIVSEARVWNRALNAIELENNQCYVDPASEGLIGYWRLDELDENGNFKDLTGNGNDGIPNSRPSWSEDIKCPVID
ncbi:MAG: DUF1735 and LamG domain-containing protein [Bacteroidales bacterium]|nr:DUF1735 and LamG domain-containing protein [Bacteroidales bacterium]MDE6147803.1 DUF1735 and LamG domain-containing protein [Bacteroidales bacterium]